MFDVKDKKILVTGGAGFLGSYVVDNLMTKRHVPRFNIFIPSSKKYDLRLWQNCEKVVTGQDLVIHLAARVGGTDDQLGKPADFFYDNLMMGSQLIEAARRALVKKFVIVGSLNSYPNSLKPPFREQDFWSGYPEKSNAAYGLAKKILAVQTQAYRAQYGMNIIYLVLPNLYGPPKHEHRSLDSQTVPLFIKKILAAKKLKQNFIEIWGTGNAKREFLFVTDAAEAILSATENYDGADILNLGFGHVVSIKELMTTLARLLKFKGEVRWDRSRKEGQSERFLDSSQAKKILNFKAAVTFEDGLKRTVQQYLSGRFD